MKPKSEINTAPPSVLGDELLSRLLNLEVKHDEKVSQLEKAIGTDGTNLYCDELIDIVLDALGVPADNTVETNAIDIANETGIWPEGAYCRDFWYDEWYDTKHSGVSDPGHKFIISVRKQLNEHN